MDKKLIERLAASVNLVQPEWANYARWQGHSEHDGQLLIGGGVSMGDLANFAAAVAEECAKVAEDTRRDTGGWEGYNEAFDKFWMDGLSSDGHIKQICWDHFLAGARAAAVAIREKFKP